MKKIVSFILLVLIGVSCLSPRKNQNPTVTVTVLPQKFFVDQIAGEWLTVNVMVPPGSSPATYEPTPIQMRNLSNSQLYFTVGHLGFEKAWINRLMALNKEMKVVNTSEGLDLIEEEEFGESHDDEHGHSHKHEEFNPHTWLSPDLVKRQAELMFKELVIAFPDQKYRMKNNLDSFLIKIDSTKKELDNLLKDKKGTSFIVYHSVWTYLAHDYGLKQVSIEFNGKEATPRKLKEIVDYAAENNIRTIFVQKEFSSVQAQSIANEINGKVIQLNPLEYNWFQVMNEFGKAFQSME